MNEKGPGGGGFDCRPVVDELQMGVGVGGKVQLINGSTINFFSSFLSLGSCFSFEAC